MRHFIILLIGLMLFLVGCNTEDDAKDSAPAAASEVDAEVDDSTDKEAESETNEEEVKVEAEQSVNDIEGVLNKMKEAVQTVESVTAKGTTDSENTVAGVTSKSTSELELKAMIDPFISHIFHTVVSGEDDDVEMYVTNDDMYVYTDDTGWTKLFLPEILAIATKLTFTEVHIDQFIVSKDLFDLTENDDYFILKYIGSDEQYKDVFYNESFHTSFESLTSLIPDVLEETEMSGSVEMKVSKETFLVAEQHSIHKASLTMHGMQFDTIDDGTHTFTYNDIDSVTIPADVVENAQELNIEF